MRRRFTVSLYVSMPEGGTEARWLLRRGAWTVGGRHDMQVIAEGGCAVGETPTPEDMLQAAVDSLSVLLYGG